MLIYLFFNENYIDVAQGCINYLLKKVEFPMCNNYTFLFKSGHLQEKPGKEKGGGQKIGFQVYNCSSLFK